jgi:YHS domain-containing protein
MAAPRHARKPAIPYAALLALVGVLTAAPPGRAATTEWVVTDRNSGLAIHGFDPVAYFVERAPIQGRGEFEYRHAGVVWQFKNPGNKAAFAHDPEVYSPRFGGYDPIGLARGIPLAGDPRIWIIAGERLYLFQSQENRAAFVEDQERAAEAADAAWPAIQRTLSP